MTVSPDLVDKLRKRAEIRRQIPGRKSVMEGAPDRISDLLEEAADALESAQAEIARLTTVLQGVREPSPVSTMDYATLDTPIGNTTKGGPKQSLTLRQWLEADNRTPQFRARLMALCIIERQQAALAALQGKPAMIRAALKDSPNVG